MENALWSDILAQGDDLRRVVNRLYGEERARLDSAAAYLRGGQPIYFIGVASSEYLCVPAEVYLAQRGLSAIALGAADALYSYLPVLKLARVVLVTRSGETAEVVKLAQALAAQGTPFVTITNEPESTTARLATYVLRADTRKDALVSINVVTGFMTAALALSAAVVGELDALRPAFISLAEAVPGVVSRAAGSVERLRDLFAGIRPVHLLHRGASRGSALNGRLVLEEIARTPAVAIDAAAFRQGPNEVVDERFGAVLFVPEGKQGALNRSLGEDLLRLGGRVLQVGALEPGEGSTGEPPDHPRRLTFPILGVPDFLRPVVEVIPVQVLAYGLAQSQGYEPGEMRYITKVILSEEGIPKEG